MLHQEINNTVGRVAGLLSVAIMGVFALSTFNRSLDPELSSLDITPEVRQSIDDQRIKILLIEIPEDINLQTKTDIKDGIEKAFLDSFRLMMLISAGLVLLGTLVALLTIQRKKPG